MTSTFLRTVSEVFQEGQRAWKDTFKLAGPFSRYLSKLSWRSLVVMSVAFKLKSYALDLDCSFSAEIFTGSVDL